jgi:DNA repair protein RecO (recombination protein O)
LWLTVLADAMPLHSTDAIIIAGHDLAEADRIIVFYTEAQGKIRAVAEGARRMRSRFGGNLQLFSEGRLVYFERANKTLHKVNEFAVSRSHQPLREDLDRIALGSAAVEAVALGVEEAEGFPGLYRLLAEALDLLETSGRPSLVFQGFTLHLLTLLGYRPELGECVRCHRRPAGASGGAVSPEHGGLVCEACRGATLDTLAVSREVLGFLRGAGAAPLRLLERVALAPGAVDEAGRVLQALLQHALGRPLRSAQFLTRL